MKTYTNCPNCGAEVDIHAEKCAYCDTPYNWCIPINPTHKAVVYADDKPMYECFPFISLEEEKERNRRIDELYEEQKRLEREMYLEKRRQEMIDAMGVPRKWFVSKI